LPFREAFGLQGRYGFQREAWLGETSMFLVKIDTEKCTGCKKCVDICPEHVLEVQDEKCVAVKPDDCQGCLSCVETCEEKAITVDEI
jgi:NAD-dependent dihydropyrimidine dehydrogenase PreA subunit